MLYTIWSHHHLVSHSSSPRLHSYGLLRPSLPQPHSSPFRVSLSRRRRLDFRYLDVMTLLRPRSTSSPRRGHIPRRCRGCTAVPGPFPELSSLPQPHPSPFRADLPLIIATAPTWLSLPRRHELASTSASVIAGTPATGGDHCRSWALSGTIRVPVPHACPRTH